MHKFFVSKDAAKKIAEIDAHIMKALDKFSAGKTLELVREHTTVKLSTGAVLGYDAKSRRYYIGGWKYGMTDTDFYLGVLLAHGDECHRGDVNAHRFIVRLPDAIKAFNERKKRVTMKAVNEALAIEWGSNFLTGQPNVELVRGRSYGYYFAGYAAATWFESGAYEYQLQDLTVPEWVELSKTLAAQ